MSGAEGRDERVQLLNLLHGALDALEAGDDPNFRDKLDAVIATRSQPVLEKLARLAHELNQTLSGLDRSVDPAVAELPDAGARLEHVIRMTEEASHRTLDLTEQSRELIDRIQASPLDPATAELVLKLRGNLSEISLAQGYQDLTGQVIRRVVDVVARVQLVLSVLPGQGTTPELAGPALDGLDRFGVSQVDADELLSDLGL